MNQILYVTNFILILMDTTGNSITTIMKNAHLYMFQYLAELHCYVYLYIYKYDQIELLLWP